MSDKERQELLAELEQRIVQLEKNIKRDTAELQMILTDVAALENDNPEIESRNAVSGYSWRKIANKLLPEHINTINYEK